MPKSYLDNLGNHLVRQAVRLARHDRSGEFTSHQNIELFQHAEAIARLEAVKNIGRLLLAAEQARELADSWREFNVGGAAFVMYFDQQLSSWRFEIAHGANAKPTHDDTINVHAEHTLMTKATEGCLPGEVVSIPFVCIIGDVQADQQSGLDSATLHPCGLCREAFLQPDTPIGPQTMFLSATSDMQNFEWYSLSPLLAFHATGDRSGIGECQFQAPPLALTFDPASIVRNGVARLSLLEDEAFVQSDHEVADNLILPMTQYAMQMDITAQGSTL